MGVDEIVLYFIQLQHVIWVSGERSYVYFQVVGLHVVEGHRVLGEEVEEGSVLLELKLVDEGLEVDY